jgi:putative serine protease PepD
LAVSRGEEVISSVLPAVVSISSTVETGSGFFVNEKTVITNYHIVGGDLRVELKLGDGETMSGEVERVSDEYDLAVVRTRFPLEELTSLSLGTASDVKVGQEVLVIGSPLGILEIACRSEW